MVFNKDLINNYIQYGQALKAIKPLNMYIIEDMVTLGNAVQNLTPKQQALALATKGLTQAEIAQVLASNQVAETEIQQVFADTALITQKKQLTKEYALEAITAQGLSATKAKEIMTSAGIIAGDNAEVISKKQVSVATLEAKLAQEGLSATQIKAITTQLGLGTSTVALSNYFKGLAASTWASVKAITAFLFTNPAGWAILAGTAIAGVVAGIVSYNKHQEELRDKALESANTLKEQADAMDDLISQYEAILDSEKTETEKVEELNKWKQTLADTYGITKEKLANLNLEREDGIKLLQEEIKYAKIKQQLDWQESNKKAIDNAKNKIEHAPSFNQDGYTYADGFDYWTGMSYSIAEDIKNLFDEVVQIDDFTIDFKIDTNNAIEEYERLNSILTEISKISIQRDLTESEQLLYNDIKTQVAYLETLKGDMEIYKQNISSIAMTKFEGYKLADDSYKNLGKDSYLSWRNGLLATAEGDKTLEKELLVLAEQQFPDYAKYFNNLDLAKSMFNIGDVNSQYEAQRKMFIDSLSETDLEIVVNHIPDLFADGLEGATAKIEAWKSDPKNKITPDVEVDDTEISTMLETVSKKVKLITTTMEEQADTGYISSSTYAEIIEMGGNFADCLEVQNGKLKLNVEKLKDLEKQELRNELAEIRLSKASWETVKATKAMGGEDTSAVDAKLRELTRQEAVINQAISEITNAKPNESGSGGSSSNSDPWKERFDKQYSEKQHLLAMEQLSEEDYLDWLDDAYKKYFSDLTKYQDEYYKYEEEVYKGRKQLLEDYYDTQQKYLEDRIDSLEAQVQVTLDTSTTSDGTELSTKEKYEYIKDTYQEIINEIETFKNEIINNGIEGHEELVAELEKQVEEYQQKIEDTFRTAVEEEKDYIEKLKDSYIDSYDERIDKIKEQKEAAEEAIQAEIDALKKVNDEKQRTNDLEKAKQKLENAKKQRTRAVLGADGTMSYQVDQDKINEAQQEYDEAMLENQIAILEEQKEIQSNGYDTLIENLENEQEAGERRFDILLKVLDEYLNPDNTTSNSDVWSKLAKMQGAKYENGTWYDKDGKTIDVENLVKSAEAKTDDKKKAETDNSKSETDSALKKFLTNMEKQFNLDAGSLTLEKVQQAFGNSISANYNPYGAMNEKTGLTANGYTSYVNNENANITSTFNGDIIINNPVGNSNDLAQELIKNLPSAINRQTHKS